MIWKTVGSVFIIVSCGFAGFTAAVSYKREVSDLRQLIRALDYMECELQYRLTPLPDLCRMAGNEATGHIKAVLCLLCDELECQISPDVKSCMRAVLQRSPELPKRVEEALQIMGTSLGRFDIDGQLKGLEAVRSYCRRELGALLENQSSRVRNYQTLGLCAGAALAVLLV